jgi:hypothetical protein
MIPPLLVVRADPTAPLRALHKRHRARFRDKASSRRVAPTASAILLAPAPARGGRDARRRRVSTRRAVPRANIDARVATTTARTDAVPRVRCLARAPGGFEEMSAGF